jgi:pimeloyl-ACP methyl ester carboxylesterase
VSRDETAGTGRPVTPQIGDQPSVQDEMITLNGLRFHYRNWGSPSAPPLILLHGTTFHARMFDPLARLLSDRYRVLALDQRGHGETEWANVYRPEPALADFAAFVEALGLAHFSLLGYSFGGAVVYSYAAQYPERVERLVMVEAGGAAAPPSPRMQAMLQRWNVPRTFDSPDEAERFVREVIPRSGGTEVGQFVRDGLRLQADGRWTWRWDPAILGGNLAPSAEFLWSALPRISCPTLYVRGADSELIPLALGEKIAAALPRGQLANIPDAGHFPFFANPTAFLAVIRDFLLQG